MRDYNRELENRAEFIRKVLSDAGADGIVYGNSGGKDSALAGILCKKACENTIGLIMPCGSRQNYERDRTDAITVARQFGIETEEIDLSNIGREFAALLNERFDLTKTAKMNIPPRLRMTALYAVAASGNRLVAGTGNRSEAHMGYFTKWGDGAYDFNPIADLTVTEIYEFLEFLDAPEAVLKKAPSAGLFEGQTDEGEMGISYKDIDNFLLNNIVSEKDREIIEKYHAASEHKRRMPRIYENKC